jgi:hypothetical protein
VSGEAERSPLIVPCGLQLNVALRRVVAQRTAENQREWCCERFGAFEGPAVEGGSIIRLRSSQA